MKIAVFYNLDFGGAKRAVFEQARRLKARGHLVDVYTTDSEIDALDLSRIASSFRKFPYKQTEHKIPFLSRLINDLRTFYLLPILHKKIAHEIDRKHYDIVLVHPDKITQAPYLLKYLKTRNVYYAQEPLRIAYEYFLRARRNIGLIKYIYEQITRSVRKKIDIINVRSATFTIASCYHIRERMIVSYGVYPYVSYLGIDDTVFHPTKTKKINQVLFVGNRNVWNDGYDLVEKSLSLIPKDKRPKVEIIEWKKNIKERLTDDELVKKYNSSIATLSLSRFETFGLVPLESMSCGTPVIATNVSGHRETVINGEGGFLVEFDPRQIAELILGISQDNKISEKGRKHILENWTWDKRIKELEVLLQKLIKTKKKTDE